MRIVSSIYNLKQLNKFIGYIDSALLMTQYSLVYEDDFDLDKAISLCLNNNVEPILAINKIMHPNDINEISIFIDKYKDKNILFYASDLGVANIAIKKGIINKFIFNPETMITNYLDLDIYQSYGFKALAMSLEIPINDVKSSYLKTNANMIYQIFGHRLMFYSKRKLISLYEKKNNDSYIKNEMYLREETRNDFLPIIENKNGTFIYRSYLISLLDNLDKLGFLEYGYLESLYLDDAIYLKVLKIYHSYLNNAISKDKAINLINELNLNIEDGFTYKDSVYQKEELKR